MTCRTLNRCVEQCPRRRWLAGAGQGGCEWQHYGSAAAARCRRSGQQTRSGRCDGANCRNTQRPCRHSAAVASCGSVHTMCKCILHLSYVGVAGADATKKDAVGTALHHAATEGLAQLIPLLIQCGCNVDEGGISGWSPLHCAAHVGRAQCIETLIAGGVCAVPLCTSHGFM